MVHLIFGGVDRASLVHLPTAISVVTYIAGVAMMQSSSEHISWAGSGLVFASALVFYVTVGIAVNSLYLSPSTRSLKSITFLAVFTVAAIVLVVSSAVTFSKSDYSPFLLVSLPHTVLAQPNIRRHWA
jgi:hypothetical protein